MDLNESFESFKSFASDAAQAAAKKAKSLAFIARSNISIHAEQERQRRYYSELGRLYYRDFSAAAERDETEYLTWCDKLTESLKKVEDLQEAIRKEREKTPDLSDEEVAEAEAAEPEKPEGAETLEETLDEVEEAVKEAVDEVAEKLDRETPEE